MLKQKKILQFCIQWEWETKQAIEFNENNNYEYLLVDDTTTIDYDCLKLLLQSGYEIVKSEKVLTLKHKNYKSEEMEKVDIKED